MKDAIIFQRLHRVDITFAVSEKIVSSAKKKRRRKKEKEEKGGKHMFGLHSHLLTQFSIIVSLKHYFLD